MLPWSVYLQMGMNNVFMASPPVVVHTIPFVSVAFSLPSWPGHRGHMHIMSQSQERCGSMFPFHHQSAGQTV